jgi:hypothetical protein
MQKPQNLLELLRELTKSFLGQLALASALGLIVFLVLRRILTSVFGFDVNIERQWGFWPAAAAGLSGIVIVLLVHGYLHVRRNLDTMQTKIGGLINKAAGSLRFPYAYMIFAGAVVLAAALGGWMAFSMLNSKPPPYVEKVTPAVPEAKDWRDAARKILTTLPNMSDGELQDLIGQMFFVGIDDPCPLTARILYSEPPRQVRRRPG